MKTVIKWDLPLIKDIIIKYLLKVVIASIVVAAVGVLAVTFLKSPEYSSNVQLSQNDNNASQISTYSQYVKTKNFRRMLDQKVSAQKKWKNKDYSIQVESGDNSVFFTIVATSSNAEFSQFLANETLEIFIKNAGKYISGVNVSVLSKASNASQPNRVNYVKIAGLIFIPAFLLFGLISVWRFIRSGRVEDAKFPEKVYQVPYLGELGLKSIFETDFKR
ncbi:hypothetical protein J4033_07070, partial [Lactiplantibacillus plantarum]